MGYQPDRLVSIASAVVADVSVNCDDAVDVGLAAAAKITGKPFTDITLHRNDKVKTMSDKQNSINIRGQNTVVNPHLFFNRISCVLKSSSDLEEFLYYELAPQPPSLFSDGVMRKPIKSSLGTLIKSFAQASKTSLKTVSMLSMGVTCCSQWFGHNLLPTEMYLSVMCPMS